MVIKVYVALISCSQEVKKNQQRAVMILESKNIPFVVIDITDPGQEDAKDYMLASAFTKPGGKVPIPPQLFNEADYCGDFETLDMSNECDSLGEFLKLTDDEKKVVKIGITGILPEERQKAREAQKAKMEALPPPAPVPTLTNGVTNGTTEEKQKPTPESTPAAPTETTPVKSEAPTEQPESPPVTTEAPKPENTETPTEAPSETKETPPVTQEESSKPTEEPSKPTDAPAEVSSPPPETNSTPTPEA